MAELGNRRDWVGGAAAAGLHLTGEQQQRLGRWRRRRRQEQHVLRRAADAPGHAAAASNFL